MKIPPFKVSGPGSKTFAGSVNDQLADWLFKCFQILQQENKAMSAEIDALKTQVASNNDLVKSAIALIQGIAAQILATAGDKAAATQLAADLKASDDALAAAIAANTPPSPPAPTPTP
jgi:hypothetical protein